MSDDLERYLRGLPKILASDIKGLDRSKSQFVYARAADEQLQPGTPAEFFASDLPPEKILAMNGLILVAHTKAQDELPDFKPEVSGSPQRLQVPRPKNRKERRAEEVYNKKKGG